MPSNNSDSAVNSIPNVGINAKNCNKVSDGIDVILDTYPDDDFVNVTMDGFVSEIS